MTLTDDYRQRIQKIREAYEKIVDITGGDCFGREALIDTNDRAIGLDGRFTAEQLKEIVKVLEQLP